MPHSQEIMNPIVEIEIILKEEVTLKQDNYKNGSSNLKRNYKSKIFSKLAL